MPHFERIRDVVSGPFAPSIIDQRLATGWQVLSIDWRRELPGNEAPTSGAYSDEIPYGLRISDDGMRLEVDPDENQVLTHMMDRLAQDFPYSAIVSDLNEKGFRTRDGHPWTRIAVFNMMPRLIEAGPRILNDADFKRQRHSPLATHKP